MKILKSNSSSIDFDFETILIAMQRNGRALWKTKDWRKKTLNFVDTLSLQEAR
jgi:hypothetical protein